MSWGAPTPVQSSTIPAICNEKDVWVEAPTGSGKTAAFALPILQHLSYAIDTSLMESRGRRYVDALVLSPTRELAIQTKHVFTALHEASTPSLTGDESELTIRAVYGGVSMNPQLTTLQAGSDVLVATPGRLLDVIKNNGCDLSSVRFLVLDEADKMLSPGFVLEVEEILNLLPPDCQKAVFSATFPFKVRPKVHKMLKEPYVRVGGEAEEGGEEGGIPAVKPDIHQRALLCDEGKRTSLLKRLIDDSNYSRLLVFANTKYSCEHIAKKLRTSGTVAVGLHGDLSQGARNQRLADFKNRTISVLVTTDVAARGIDIDSLDAVVNYDLPRSPAEFMHRCGRTGRAGESGDAVSFVHAEVERHWDLIVERNDLEVATDEIEGFHSQEEWDRILESTRQMDSFGGIKSKKKKSKKDKLREAAAAQAGKENTR